MKNLFISNLNKKDVDHFTTDIGLLIRRKTDKAFKKICNVFTNVNIIRENFDKLSDDEHFTNYPLEYKNSKEYPLNAKKHNIILERYPELNDDEPYIFVSNHTCPEDIETILNVLDRNAYLVLGSIDSLKYNPEMYLSFLNGMIPFDIMDKKERHELMDKMARVLKTNSILIFPEGSHNFSPNKLINNLYDGPVNLSLRTGRKIVLVTLVRDNDNNVSYIDVSNPIDVKNIDVPSNLDEKNKVKCLSSYLRDKMATAVYCLSARHLEMIHRVPNDKIEDKIREEKIEDAFKKLHWNKDVFEAEYLTKKTKEEIEYNEVQETISNLRYDLSVLRDTLLDIKDYVIRNEDVHNKDVVEAMRKHLILSKNKKI